MRGARAPAHRPCQARAADPVRRYSGASAAWQAAHGGSWTPPQDRGGAGGRHLPPAPPAQAHLGQGAGVAGFAAADGGPGVTSRWLTGLMLIAAPAVAQDPLAPLPTDEA